jgi:nucleotide-binding universal stress UspA family protein
MFKPERILVPTDFSEKGLQTSKIAIKQAVAIARESGSELVFLHVITDDISKKPLFFLDDDKINQLKKDIRANAKNELVRFAKKYVGDTQVKYKIKIRQGVAYDEILKEEKESGIDLISIATRGHSGLHDFFYGSTTEKVVRRATCNVLVVRKFADR